MRNSPPLFEVLTHYLLPVLLVAILTNVPRFLEMEHVWDTVQKTVEDPFTGALHTVILVGCVKVARLEILSPNLAKLAKSGTPLAKFIFDS